MSDFWNNRITNRDFITVGVTCAIGWVFSYLAIYVFEDYAFGLFVWLPFVLGAISTLIYSYKNVTTRKTLRNISYWTLLFFCLGLLFFAWEGVICLIMAAPIGFFFTWIGHLIGYEFVKHKITGTPTAVILLFFSVPCLMAFENANETPDKLRTIVTTIDIDAAPEEVWKNVVEFPQLQEPTEFIFKTGIAYPINATITGKGVGAIRSCNFSTGNFIEPIKVWNEPELLKFSVVEQPAPMTELSMYDIEPNHIHGYWVSKQGQFKLTKLPNGHTLLEGTTWYFNKIKPGAYWTLWSDYIVHKIHNRVLQHIKVNAEKS